MARPLPDLVLFLDECLGAVDVPEALRAAGCNVELLRDHFDAGTEDTVWLTDIGGRDGWVVLTSDKRIRRRRAELQALISANVVAFVLTSGDLTGIAAGAAFAKAYPRMQKLVRDQLPPFIATVTASGAVTLLTKSQRRGGKKKDP